MKRKYSYFDGKKQTEREYSYIPFRYIAAVLITLFEVLAVIGIVVACCYYVPYFYLAAWATEIFCVIRIIASDDNPDYKVPWLLFVLIIPIAGFMLYFMFYSRTLQKRFIKRLDTLKSHSYKYDDSALLEKLQEENSVVASQTKMLCGIAETHLFTDTGQEYFPLGEDMHRRLLEDLETAEKFIYMEYFIIEEGKFWNSILEILKRKAAEGGFSLFIIPCRKNILHPQVQAQGFPQRFLRIQVHISNPQKGFFCRRKRFCYQNC